MDATVQLAVFDLDHQLYGLPLARVERVVRAGAIAPLPHAPAVVQGVIDLHGALIPVISVRRCLGVGDRPIDVNDQFVIARTSRRTVALIVDHVRDIIGCPAGAVIPGTGIVPRWNEIQGIVQLEDGLILIQDLDRFLPLQEDQMLEESLREQHGT